MMAAIRRHGRKLVGVVPLILLVALAFRLVGIDHGLPYGYYPDETHFIKRALAFGSFDFNPHWFHKPAFFMYVLFFEYGVYFLVGKILGWFTTDRSFAVSFISDPTYFYLIGRLTVLALGLGGIFVTSRIARTMGGAKAAALAALFLAATMAHAASCQNVKADIPSSFFTLASLYFLVKASSGNRVRDYLLCGFVAGLGMATKYYAIFMLVPLWLTGFVVSVRGPRSDVGDPSSFRPRSPDASFGVLLLASGVFLLGFFLASPYNFLDSFWYDVNLRPMIKAKTTSAVPILRLCDLYLGARLNRTNLTVLGVVLGLAYGVFVGGVFLARWLGRTGRMRVVMRTLALTILIGGLFLPMTFSERYADSVLELFQVVISPGGMGPWLGGWGLLAMGLLLLRRDRFALILVAALVSFVVMANVYLPNVAEPRHLNAIYPLLCLAGALLLVDLTRRVRRQRVLLLVIGGVISFPGLLEIAQHDLVVRREDTRSEAARWVEANIPAGSRILSDKDWIKLFPSADAISRKREAIQKLDGGSAFAVHKGTYYDLLEEASQQVPRPTYDLLVLDPPWWAREERSDGVYNSSDADKDMGDPTAHRIPYRLDEYSRRGFQYVVTTSKTFTQYTREPWRSSWPSLARFYDELLALEPLQVFPADPDRRPGPEARIYALHHQTGGL